MELKYQQYYAPKGKQLDFAFGNCDKFHYTIFVNKNVVEVLKETFEPYNVEGVSLSNVAISDIIAIIENDKVMMQYMFASEEECKPLKDMVGNDHIKMIIN